MQLNKVVMIIRINTPIDDIPQDDYCNLCMVYRAIGEDDESRVMDTLLSNCIEEISFIPNESFVCDSSDRAYSISGGVILISNKDLREEPNFIPQFQFEDKRDIRFHKIEAIILDNRLFTKEWLEYAFHTIFDNIVNEDEESKEVVWVDYNNELYTVPLNKEYDKNENRLNEEASKISCFILKILHKT